jgi:hypothetical protein
MAGLNEILHGSTPVAEKLGFDAGFALIIGDTSPLIATKPRIFWLPLATLLRPGTICELVLTRC